MPLLPAPPSLSPAPACGYVGEVAYILACDVAYEMPREVTGTLLGQPVGHCGFDPQNHHAPRKPLFYRPDIYRRTAGLLHLEDWRRTLNDKLTTLDSL